MGEKILDVLIVGAGISGVGAARHLKTRCPDRKIAVFEALDSFGGTWKVHTYPGIRSDSDLYTFGYRDKPWTGPPIAAADQILTYMGEFIEENDLAPLIHYNHKITKAEWSSAEKLYTVTYETPDGEHTVKARFLWMCQGYYDLDKGYTPDWEGMDSFKGEIVHPQNWPDNIDLSGKKVVVIGSGATAATLVPNIAGDCAHVTLLQRSPTYFAPGRNINELADELRRLEIDEEWIHTIIRKKVLVDQHDFTQRAKDEPDAVKGELLEAVKAFLGDDFDMKHFTPSYRPWRQRIAFVPDGDIFQGIASGKASVVTDHIDRFVPEGIKLKSGDVLEADVIITATGFNLKFLGNIPFVIDGETVDWNERLTWRGMMVEDVPNMLFVFGYFRASWTLRVDLLGDFMVRLLAHMDEVGAAEVRPEVPDSLRDMERMSWMDAVDFNPGYLQRGQHLMPKRVDHPDWQHTQDYWHEKDALPQVDLDEAPLVYEDASGQVVGKTKAHAA
ncbi:NAD(P)/FAD-dependent oxidoreductase [Henriciella sp.]|jgi:cation diffusion facilitator CzcD-associated flavoprotein CzcO|uniref:flavin-containing monooxygenase n=1 Tax=Henriciella sp. TaxID=1968823 RepID=UPI000C0E1FD2|nr:NAD(P)/FAD-dependent oxidoreductase [Henriciella sp.]PHR79628.1 MAG: FAD-containing monooxygenase EthA [Henriciella sp.]